MYKKSKARIELDKDRDFILWLFDGKCIRCGRPTNIIHEIIPISHGKSALHWKNRVPICDSAPKYCHTWAHGVGTRNSIPILEEKRKKFLIQKFELETSDMVSDEEVIYGND